MEIKNKILTMCLLLTVLCTAVYAFELNDPATPKKAVPVASDLVGIEDSQDEWKLKAVELGNYPASQYQEPRLPLPSSNGLVLSSTTTGTKTWVAALAVDGVDVGDTVTWNGTAWEVIQITTPVQNALAEKAGTSNIKFVLSALTDLEINGGPLVKDSALPTDPDATSRVYSVHKLNQLYGGPYPSSYWDSLVESTVFAAPDELVAVTRSWPVVSFPNEMYPNGVTLTSIRVSTDSTCTDALVFEEWNMGTASSASTVANLTMSGVYTKLDTFVDADLAANTTLYIDMPATPTDVTFYDVVVTFSAN